MFLLLFLLIVYSTATPDLPHGHLRHVMLYEFKKGSSQSIAHTNIKNVYGNDAPSPHTIQRWFAKFRNGEISLEDEEHPGKEPQLQNEEILQKIHETPRISTRELADAVNYSHTTIIRHLHQMGFKPIFGHWVPHFLTDPMKGQRSSISAALLSRYERKSFLPNLITGDEKWMLTANFQRKRQWIGEGVTPANDVLPDPHQKKYMLCVWWDMLGVLYWELMDNKQTIKALTYSAQLQKLDEEIKKKRPNMKKVILLIDNARPHTANLTRSTIHSLNWELLPHPPYSPDLSPTDYHLFRSMQHSLDGEHFQNEDDLKKWLQNYFDSKPKSFFEGGIRQLPVKWAKVIENNGNYFD